MNGPVALRRAQRSLLNDARIFDHIQQINTHHQKYAAVRCGCTEYLESAFLVGALAAFLILDPAWAPPFSVFLWCSRIDVLPAALQVGDYVLSPEIVIERKALPDLFSSFPSGRLYHQAEAMCRHYKTPILLIEFEEDKQFALQAPSDVGNDISSSSIMSKLVLLTLHFPKLRSVWSDARPAGRLSRVVGPLVCGFCIDLWRKCLHS